MVIAQKLCNIDPFPFLSVYHYKPKANTRIFEPMILSQYTFDPSHIAVFEKLLVFSFHSAI